MQDREIPIKTIVGERLAEPLLAWRFHEEVRFRAPPARIDLSITTSILASLVIGLLACLAMLILSSG